MTRREKKALKAMVHGKPDMEGGRKSRFVTAPTKDRRERDIPATADRMIKWLENCTTVSFKEQHAVEAQRAIGKREQYRSAPEEQRLQSIVDTCYRNR